MLFFTCPNCGELHHDDSRYTEAQLIEQYGDAHPTAPLAEHCMYCARELREFDMIRVLRRSPLAPEARSGDLGIVTEVSAEGSHRTYTVKHRGKAGEPEWVGHFSRSELYYLCRCDPADL